ncbi:MAG: aquaporin [Myxococcota bacterium]|nr:aquaporin [Myxococcota bacterium]
MSTRAGQTLDEEFALRGGGGSGMNTELSKRALSEMIGTFALVFIGTGAIVVNDVTGGAISHLGIALAFGLVVMTMIYAVGDVSGAHLNPAVSLAFWVARRLPRHELFAYWGGQFSGAILASLLLRAIFYSHETLGVTTPAAGLTQSFVLEVVLTFFLMFVILGVATGAKEKGIMAGVAVGAMVCLGALFGGPVSGASLNPARSLAPALVTGALASVWLYLLAPCVGAWFAVGACRVIREPGCCR